MSIDIAYENVPTYLKLLIVAPIIVPMIMLEIVMVKVYTTLST